MSGPQMLGAGGVAVMSRVAARPAPGNRHALRPRKVIAPPMTIFSFNQGLFGGDIAKKWGFLTAASSTNTAPPCSMSGPDAAKDSKAS